MNNKTVEDFFMNKKKIGEFFDEINNNLFLIKINEEIIMNNEDIILLNNITNFISQIDKFFEKKNIPFVYIIYKKKTEQKVNSNNIKKILEKFFIYNQCFIDNLNNEFNKKEKYSIYDIYNFSLDKNKIIDNKDLMREILDDAFVSIKEKDKNEKENNYKNLETIKICLKKNNNNIFELIIKKLKNLMREKNFSISKIMEEKKKNEDFIRATFNKIKGKISFILKNIINYLEDDLALSTILFSNLSSDREKKQLENDFNVLLNKFNEIENYNGIKYIYIGFKLVGLLKDYKKLSLEISNKIKNNSEINIMERIILNANYSFKKKLDSNSENEIKYLFNDYILYFITIIIELKTIKDNRDKIIIYLNLILKLCLLDYNDISLCLTTEYYIDKIINNKKKQLPNIFLKMCVFLEENKCFLSKILQLLNDFLSIIPNFNEKIKEIYVKNKINNSKKRSKIFGTFLDCITDEFKFTLYFNDNTKEKYIELLYKIKGEFKNILYLINSEDKNYSISMLNIEIFLYIIKKDKFNDKNLVANILKFLQEEIKNNYNINQENNYENDINLLLKNMKDKTFLSVLIKQFQKNKKNLNIMEVFLSNKNFEEYSLFFLENILEEYIYSINFKNDANDFIIFDEEFEKKTNDILMKKENNLFKETILYYFECYFENLYFKKIEEDEKDKQIKYEKILINKDNYKSLDLVKKYLNYSDNNQEPNLNLLYRMAYIKLYFKYFVEFMYECKNGNNYINFDSIIKDLFLKTRKFNFLYEIKNLLEIKCEEGKQNFDSFIAENGINYLNFDNNDINQKIPLIKSLSRNYPNKGLIKKKFNLLNNNKEKYPLLNQFLNNEVNMKFIKYIPKINYISNAMLDIYSYKLTKEEIHDTKLNENEINNNIKNYSPELYNNFEKKMLEYIKCYNSFLEILGLYNKKINSDYRNKPIEIFLINEKFNNNEVNELNNIYNILIEYQNDFISKIQGKYFKNKIIEEINIQDASENNIPKFCPLDDEFLQILLKNVLIKNISVDNGLMNIDFDYEEIEAELAEKTLSDLKIFRKKIRTMKYKEDIPRLDDDILDDFISKYKMKLKDINNNQKDYIKTFIKNHNLNDINNLLLSILNIMVFILSKSDSEFNPETNIQDVIGEIKEEKIEKYKNILAEFFGKKKEDEEEEEEDILEQMNNNNENGIDIFHINNLVSIYNEILMNNKNN